MDTFIRVIRQSFDYRGRARRREYWVYCLVLILIMVVLLLTTAALGGLKEEGPSLVGGIFLLLYIAVAFASFFPTLAVCVRRLHDTNRSGWWYLINFIPLIGPLVFLVFSVLPGTTGDNRFGPDPKSLGNHG